MDQLPGLGWCNITPGSVFFKHVLMESRQDFVLETTLLADVQDKAVAFLRLESRIDKEAERAGRKFFQAANRRVQHIAVELLCQRRIKFCQVSRAMQVVQPFQEGKGGASEGVPARDQRFGWREPRLAR
jgi:hypothetical protein